jgi:energy-coupling factor transporter transmembrane protein EcfT
MAETISQIDRIRAVDVPWRMYLIMFIILMILLGLITGGLFQALRLPTTFMILAMVSLVVLMIIAFLVITFYGFKQEEIQDAKRLAALYNEIKVERINQLNNVRAGLKLKNLNLGRPKKDVDIQFLRTYNKFRMQANVFANGPQNG